MGRESRFFSCLVLSTSLLLAACAEPPTKEMNEAQGALDTARAAGAAEYAADEFKAADTALTRSRQAVADRDYRQALNFALDARDRAQTAARQAADEKARVHTEADRALRAADASLNRVRERLEAATAARVPAQTLTAARQAVAAAERTVAAAHTAFDSGAYHRALAGLADLGPGLDRTISEIDAAVAARATRRPARRNR